MRGFCFFVFGAGMLCQQAAAGEVLAEEVNEKSLQPGSGMEMAETINYPAGFFEQYHPLTALDMVSQVPGFQIDDGDDLRGFGQAAGNVLINHQRPSAKQDLPSALLARIPATSVDHIELIGGQSRDINVQGHVVLVNVILKEEVLATNRWAIYSRDSIVAPPAFGGSLSLSDRWAGIDYNVGLDLTRETNGISGTVDISDAAGEPTEVRFDDKEETGTVIKGLYLNATSLWGETTYHLNSKFGFSNLEELELSHRISLLPGNDTQDIHFREKARQPQFELGLDGERLLSEKVRGKAILVFNRDNQHLISSQESFHTSGDRFRYRQADARTITTEAIARTELDWSGVSSGHAIKTNFEVAYNSLDNGLTQIDDTGAGAVLVDVPNANSRVEELRGDVLLKDNWSLGRWTLDYGLGAETSTITQTGDTEQERSFFFLKPQGLLTYSLNPQEQSRLRLVREVSQLNFNDFVSSTVFVDDDLALGNPNLKPETTWIAEFSHERRFGELGVARLTIFHHWITDVLDLLPLTDEFEVPGNIGDGRRWGVEVETTLPLTWLNLTGARLDLRMRWQDSSVTDPVTGVDRELSANGGFGGFPTIHFYSENEYVADITYRQDFGKSDWAWGWDTAFQADRPLFKVNELETFNEGVELNAFVETTRWLGMKIRLEGNNLLDYTELRGRTTYIGRRGLTPVQQHELRSRNPARQFTITFSGSF